MKEKNNFGEVKGQKRKSTSESIIEFNTEENISNKKKILTKSEKLVIRQTENKKWQLNHKDLTKSVDLNPRHTLFFQSQISSLKDEKEWKNFTNFLRMPLPVTFRLNSSLEQNRLTLIERKLRKLLSRRGKFIKFNDKIIEDENFGSKLPFFPYLYQLLFDNSVLGHEDSVKDLHNFISRENELNFITRQEIVSMVPVALLDIQENDVILDCCAAPGSKTDQLLNALHSAAHKNSPDSLPSGFIVANDSDSKRLLTLMNRFSKRPSPNLGFTCMNGESLTQYFESSDMNSHEIFDKIICDVPCSGDGTLRKCPHLWRLFRPRIGVEFHSLQLSIASEAFRLLKVGGRMVYSTCALNPFEDEAVIASLLKKFKGKIRLIDGRKLCQEFLPGLKYREGETQWSNDIETILLGESEEEKKKSKNFVPKNLSKLNSPTEEELETCKELKKLKNCLRFLPHDQNTGGFFVVVLEKIKSTSLPKKKLNEIVPQVSTQDSDSLQVVKNKDNKTKPLQELGYNPKKEEVNDQLSDSFLPQADINYGKLFSKLFNMESDLFITENQINSSEVDKYNKSLIIASKVPRYSHISSSSEIPIVIINYNFFKAINSTLKGLPFKGFGSLLYSPFPPSLFPTVSSNIDEINLSSISFDQVIQCYKNISTYSLTLLTNFINTNLVRIDFSSFKSILSALSSDEGN